jgi:hypothetical protein
VLSASYLKLHYSLQQTIKDLFEEPSGLESLVKDDSKVEDKDIPQAKADTVGTTTNGGETLSLNDDMIEQVFFFCL